MAKSKKKVTEELARVRYIGPKMADALYDDHGVRTIAEIVEFGDDGGLTELKGVGDKKASTILSSARRIAESNGRADEAPDIEPPDQGEEPEKEEKQKPQRGDGRAAAADRSAPAAEIAAGGGRTAAAAGEPTRADTRQQRAAETRELRARFIDTLRCPACGHDRFDVGASTLTCQACQRQFNIQNGIADLAPPAPPDRSMMQKVMESRTYTRLYEEFMRPNLTRIVSSRTMREEYQLSAEFLDFEDVDEMRLLDVGCGTANFTRYLAQRLGLAETPATEPDLPLVVGMDLSWPMLENARRNIRQENLEGKVFLLRGDAARIPVRRGAYNRLHCAGTLHLMSDIDEGLRNFARVLEPNGVCVIGTFILGKGLIRRMLKRVAEFPTRFHWFSRDELLRRIERAGFEVVDYSLAGDAITVKSRRI